MKPILLAMQAFGPFAEREVIDFRALGEHPLFLINGATGAGKTTILDAISYALFGKTTGAERQGEQMRCHHAGLDVATEVDFIFAIGTNIYRVQRLPTQWRPKLRGEGLKEDRATATLWQITAGTEPAFDLNTDQQKLLASRKVNDVTQHVEQLIGLKADQFRQVVVLPQGKFRELLTADAGQREDIFAQLFQTHRYLLIEEQLKESARELRQQMRQHEQNLQALLDDAKVTSKQELTERLQQLRPQLSQLEQQKTSQAKAVQQLRSQLLQAQHVQKQFAQQQQLLSERDQLRNREPQINTQQQRLERAKKAQQLAADSQHLALLQQQSQELRSRTEQLQTQQQQLSESKQQVEQAYQRALQLDDDNQTLRRQLEQQRQWLPKLESLQQMATEQQQLAAKLTQDQRQLTEIDEELQQQRENNIHAQQQLDELRTALDQQTSLEAEQHQLTLWQQQRQRHEELERQQQQLRQQQQQLQQQLLAQRATTHAAEQQSQHLENRWYDQQALTLARTLESGKPCPVCGATEHPSPAHNQNEELVEHQQVIAARKTFQQEQQKQQQLEQQLSHSQNRLDLVQQQLHENGEPKAPQQLDQLRQQLAAKASHYQQQRRQLVRLNQQISEGQQRLEQLGTKQRTLAERIHQQQLQKQTADERLRMLRQEIPEDLRSAEQLQQSMSALEHQLQQNLSRQRRATEQREQLLEQLSAVASQLDSTGQQAKNVQQQHQHVEQKFQKQLQELGFASNNDYESARLSSGEYQQLEQQIAEFKQQVTRVDSLLFELQQALDGKQAPDIDALQQQQQAAESELQRSEQDWLALRDQCIQLENVLKRVNNSKKQAEQLHKRYAVQGTLADVASGQNTQRLSLHRFVLSVLLDDVLNVASERLQQMTHGRYQLLREQTVADARSAGGLTLLVEDAYTGQQRSTKTLSGGEGFMAALALALGLSDVVQSYAGGIRLDTLFVDEGFGSLDDEALDMAINTLAELRASGRTIGIISHVRELKDRLQDRIDVIRERSGSRIVMRTQ
ncbi:AAA family ATPase [Idiomarina aquatica]|uniref:Rad50/SbcC-type AAA domain-containing protein n=1 Tax=Idiomarina aquatica TaxID=1327752 RepID=A0AA94EDZ5_9GAMM|nr:SMC family ATPase [Idiomarina aquatica]RUO40254.1 hypothetical protein CWE23_11640 [Idiomarina aquatica]